MPRSVTWNVGFGKNPPSVNAATPPLACSSGESCTVTENALIGSLDVRLSVTGTLRNGVQALIAPAAAPTLTAAGSTMVGFTTSSVTSVSLSVVKPVTVSVFQVVDGGRTTSW